MLWYAVKVFDYLIVLSCNETNTTTWLSARNAGNEVFAEMQFHWIIFKGFLHNCFLSAHIHITYHMTCMLKCED